MLISMTFLEAHPMVLNGGTPGRTRVTQGGSLLTRITYERGHEGLKP
jgi:hypothetical protein